MKLKKLQLQGYKTFASKTEFDFNSGITAVVGPNGSGKSNIADAIRWVLGEQSYSTLRGKRTSDMIFSGSQTRTRGGMAQAVLTLDNADGWLPIDYAEVDIARRAFRSGENEYLINGQKVRLRDVQDLLATSGLAERTYTIIGQGLIDQALSLRAEERRALFEEAAGVSHYQARRAETLRRLQETQRNLERVHDILSEIRPRLGALKRQASRARTYEQVEMDLRHLLRIWYGYQWEERKRALRQQRVVAGEAEAAWKESRSVIAEKQAKIDRLRREINQLQNKLVNHQSKRELLREQRESASRRVAVLGERAKLLARQISELAEDVPRLEVQQHHVQSALDEASVDLQAARDELSNREHRLERFNQSFQTQQEEIDRWTETLSGLEAEQRIAQKLLAQAEGQFSQLQERLGERQLERDDGNELLDLTSIIERLDKTAISARENLAGLSSRRQELKSKINGARSDQVEAQKEQKRRQERLSSLKESVARLESRCDLLNQMRNGEVKIGPRVRSFGRITTLIDLPADHRLALEAALGTRLATLILYDEASLEAVLRAQEDGYSLFAAVAPSIVAPAACELPHDPEVIAWASDIVDVPEKIEAVARLLFQPILLVRSREAATKLGRELPSGTLAVAPDGFIVHSGGLVEVPTADPQQSIIAREEAWRAAREELEAARSEAQTLRQAIAGQQKIIEAQEKALGQLSYEDQLLGRQQFEAEQRLNHVQRDLDRARQRQAFYRQQQKTRREEIVRLEQRMRDVQSRIDEQREQVVHLEIAAGDARTRLQDLPLPEAEQQRQSRRQEIETARTIVAGRQAVVESRQATLQQVDNQLRRQQERYERLEREQQQLDLSRAQDELQELQNKIEKIDEQLAPLSTNLQQLQDDVRELEDVLAEAQRKTHDVETYYTQMKVDLSQRENQLEGLIERIRADLGLVDLQFDEHQGGQTPLPMKEVVDRLPEVIELPENIRETIQDYRGQLHRIGSVNPEAPLEYEQTLERYEFLTQQIEDLNQTEKRLRQVIAELDDLTSRAFAATVNKVDGIFAELFERLFGGGSAQLVLTEPDDLTISGVDIVCRLPSRRQQRLGLLSGGERSLTATALIFALLKVSPPPFCVMDEVDAMLDEANVNRFREVLRELAHGSQFIVITHNRGTVQAAQTVYGISMGADSASQVISIKPEEYVNGNTG